MDETKLVLWRPDAEEALIKGFPHPAEPARSPERLRGQAGGRRRLDLPAAVRGLPERLDFITVKHTPAKLLRADFRE